MQNNLLTTKMKYNKVIPCLLICFVLASNVFSQSVGIGTDNINPSAKLEVQSSNKGFLPPRMTFAQRNAIANPTAGLTIWCTDCNEMQVFNGIIWKNIAGYAASGPSVPTIRICNVVWMLKNLNVRTYRNGDSIPVVTDPVQWANLTTGAMCWWGNNPTSYDSIYGPLYNWYAVNDPRGIAPEGWHVSTEDEWKNTCECVGGDSIASIKMRDTSNLWNYNLPLPIFADNSSGFTGLPGGYRQGEDGFFTSLGTDGGFWWTSTEAGFDKAFINALVYDGAMVLKGAALKKHGSSIRCVKD